MPSNDCMLQINCDHCNLQEGKIHTEFQFKFLSNKIYSNIEKNKLTIKAYYII